MRPLIFIGLIVLGWGSLLTAQSMVGLPKEEVRTIMEEDHPEFRKDESVIKQRFNYLKFVNRERTKTWIIYFDEKDVCTVSKVICDYAYLDEVLSDIESRYQKKGELEWEFNWGGKPVCLEIIKQDWYFTVREARKCKGE